jgi:hypothetical protein
MQHHSIAHVMQLSHTQCIIIIIIIQMSHFSALAGNIHLSWDVSTGLGLVVLCVILEVSYN